MNYNQDEGVFICSNCGNQLLNQHISCCPKCGNNIDKQTAGHHDIEIQYNLKPPKEKKNSAIIFLTLSIINLVTIVPSVSYFFFLWVLLGALSNDEFLYYGVLLFCCGYFGASIVSIIAFIINLIKKGEILKKCFLAIFIGFCLSVIAPIIWANSNYGPSKPETKKYTLIENLVIFQNDDLIIKQQQIHYDKSNVKIYFSLETQEIDNYSLLSYVNVQVNQCPMTATLSKMDDSSYDNLYYICISYNDLKTYNIKDIYTINFNIYNKKDNSHINLNMKTRSISADIDLENYDLIYSNEYFNLYLDPNYRSSSANLYIQSLVYNNYSLYFSNADFDTPGNLNFPTPTPYSLYDYSLTNLRLYLSAGQNMRYAKFDYIIRDAQHKVIAQEHVELHFSHAKIN